jgi:hypothetical protein
LVEETFKKEEIKKILSKQHYNLVDVFSKKESDILSSSRYCDYKIQLKGQGPAGVVPLYKMTVKELETARDYIIENLKKGFIIPSIAPYTLPILIARKPGGGLCFCVDYRKFNALIKKDPYSISFIDKMIDRLKHIKIFSKLDIR